MISQKEMLDIICTEAIEFGGLQEVPPQQHGGKTSFHAPKRQAHGSGENNGGHAHYASPTVPYELRLVKKTDGTLQWKD
jgi:hypothetical protein